MRGIGYTLSRLPTARALLAGAAILAGAFTSAAHGQMSGSGNGKGTPDHGRQAPPMRPRGRFRMLRAAGSTWFFLSRCRPADAVLMRRIFAFQARGDIPSAVRATAELDKPAAARDHAGGPVPRPLPPLDARMNCRIGWSSIAICRMRRPSMPCCSAGCRKVAAPPPPPDAAIEPARRADPVPEDIDPPRDDLARNPLLDTLFWSVRSMATRFRACG